MLQSVSIDKLSFVSGLHSRKALEELVNVYSETRGLAKFPYRHFYRCASVLVQIAEPGVYGAQVPMCRFEYNPAMKLEGITQVFLDRLWPIVKEPRMTRVDIALDYMDIDIGELPGEYQVRHGAGRTVRKYYGKDGKLETYYWGKGHNQIRIYNKAREQKWNGKWWRIEAQVRDSKPFANNPFKGLHLARSKLDGLTWKDIAILEYLERNPGVFNGLHRNQRARLKEKKAKLRLVEKIMPEKDFEKNKSQLVNQLAKEIKSPGYVVNPFDGGLVRNVECDLYQDNYIIGEKEFLRLF